MLLVLLALVAGSGCAALIYGQTLRRRQFPDPLFIASAEVRRQLSEASARLRAGP